jgi:aspartate/methionine/tyrosine aminotransferase
MKETGTSGVHGSGVARPTLPGKDEMRYTRPRIEVESPEEIGYANIRHNLAESSVSDVVLADLHLDLDALLLEYGTHRGKAELRELIAADAGGSLKPADVLTTVGASGALFMVMSAVLNEGDHVVVAHPNYSANLRLPGLMGARVELLEQRFEDGYRVDLERLASMVTPSTRLVSLTSPHNPTGATIPLRDLEEIIRLIEAQGSLLLFDETYRELHLGEPLPPVASLSESVVSVSSLSKTYGVPGVRLGWVMSRNLALIDLLLAAKESIHITHSVVDEEIAFRCLSDKEHRSPRILEGIRTNLALLRGFMSDQSDLEWIEPSGGVTCFPRVREPEGVDLDRFYQLLNERHGTYVGPGDWFDMNKRNMRIGYGWPQPESLSAGLAAIRAALQHARKP